MGFLSFPNWAVTPVPQTLLPHCPRKRGKGPVGWGWGVGNPFSLTRREELLPVITCAPELGLSQDCLGQDATFSPLRLSSLGTG